MVARLFSFLLAATLLAPAPAAADHSPRTGLKASQISAIPTGCWQTRVPLYGAYSVAFCLSETGSGLYRVQGEGHECTGRASWAVSFDRREVVYQMQRGDCGATAAWTADRVECRLGRDRAGDIGCTYFPNAGGFSPTRFIAYPQRRHD